MLEIFEDILECLNGSWSRKSAQLDLISNISSSYGYRRFIFQNSFRLLCCHESIVHLHESIVHLNLHESIVHLNFSWKHLVDINLILTWSAGNSALALMMRPIAYRDEPKSTNTASTLQLRWPRLILTNLAYPLCTLQSLQAPDSWRRDEVEVLTDLGFPIPLIKNIAKIFSPPNIFLSVLSTSTRNVTKPTSSTPVFSKQRLDWLLGSWDGNKVPYCQVRHQIFETTMIVI